MGDATNLVSISGGEPNAGVVEALEGLLADARSGRIRELAYVTSCRDGHVGTEYVVDPLRSDVFLLLGGASYLHHRILTEGVQSCVEV